MEPVLDIEIEDETSEYERERGKPMPSLLHSKAQRNLLRQMLDDKRYEAYPEINLDLNGFRAVPDIAVFLKKHFDVQTDLIWVRVPPQLVIEILSPRQDLHTLFEEAKTYLQHGVEEAWIVVPEMKTITVCKANGAQKTFVEGSITHASTGITVSLDRTFE
jgi:Uma2 family endonuclease